jgi:cobalt/nickel transport system permease protein
MLLGIFPLTIAMRADLPMLYLLKKTTLVYPFVFMMGVANSIIDSTPLIHIGAIPIAGGWISLLTLFIRSTLSVSAVFILIATTSFAGICQALERLGLPDIFATQLLFLYRYIFVLAEETARISHARELRSCGNKGRGTASFSALTGQLLMRTWQRAERIHNAMLARGFTGGFHTRREANFGRSESLFISTWCMFFIVLYVISSQRALGTLP